MEAAYIYIWSPQPWSPFTALGAGGAMTAKPDAGIRILRPELKPKRGRSSRWNRRDLGWQRGMAGGRLVRYRLGSSLGPGSWVLRPVQGAQARDPTIAEQRSWHRTGSPTTRSGSSTCCKRVCIRQRGRRWTWLTTWIVLGRRGLAWPVYGDRDELEWYRCWASPLGPRRRKKKCEGEVRGVQTGGMVGST